MTIKGLSIFNNDSPTIYVIENKLVSEYFVAKARKNAGGKNEGKFHYVIENKWCKNVRFTPLHYANENKQVIASSPLYS